MSDETPAGAPPAQELPPMPESAVLMAEGKIRQVPDYRELERAPKTLRIAAVLLMVACLIPWTGHGGGWMTNVLAKASALLSCFLFFAAVKSRTTDPVPARLGRLAKPRWGKPFAHKTSGFVEALAHAVPTPLHVLAIVLAIVSLAVAWHDPLIASKVAASANEPASSASAMAEIGLLLLGGTTLVHVYAYRRGAHFSPLYPFVFLGPVAMGALRVPSYWGLVRGGSEASVEISPLLAFSGLVGSVLATVAGLIAVVTIAMAMVEAKKHGDAKKAAALEARRAARKARTA